MIPCHAGWLLLCISTCAAHPLRTSRGHEGILPRPRPLMWHSGEQDAQQTPLSTYSTDDPIQQQQMHHLPLYAQPHHPLAQPTTAGMFSFSAGPPTTSIFPPDPTPHTARTQRSSWRSRGAPPTSVASPPNLQQQQPRLPPRYFHHPQIQQQQQPQFHHSFTAPILLQAPPYGLTLPTARSSLGGVAMTGAASGIGPPRPVSSPLAYGMQHIGWGGQQLGTNPLPLHAPCTAQFAKASCRFEE